MNDRTRKSADRPPRILIIASSGGLCNTGGEIYLSKIITFLKERTDLHMITMEDIPLSFRRNRFLRNVFLFSSIIKLKPEIIIEESYLRPSLFLCNILLTLGFRTKIVLFVQDLYYPPSQPGWRQLLSRLQTKIWAREATGIIANSHYMKRTLESLGIPSKRIIVISPTMGIDQIANTERKPKDGKRNLLCVANLTPRKGQHVLIQAMNYLGTYNDVNLRIVGKEKDIGYAYEIKSLAQNMNLGHKVQFCGQLERHSLAYEYCSADVFVLPSLYESKGMVLLEAMSFGLPVIASNVGGIGETVISGYNGLLFSPNDPEALARAIMQTINNPGFCKRLSENAKKTALSAPTWTEVTASVWDFLRKVREWQNPFSAGAVALGLKNFILYKILIQLIRGLFSLHQKIRGNSGIIPKKMQKILVSRMAWSGGIGDIITFIPTLKALRTIFPNAFITLITATQGEELIRPESLVDEIVICSLEDFEAMKKRERLRFIHDLRARKPDLFISSTTDLRIWNSLLAYFSGAKYRVGFEESIGDFLYNIKVPICQAKSERERNLDLVRLLGWNGEECLPQLHCSPQDTHRVYKVLKEEGIDCTRPIIGIHPFGSRPTRSWMPERYVELTDRLCQKGFQVVFTGSANDAEAINRLRKYSNSACFSLAGKMSLCELLAFIKACTVFISIDSGPMHMAVVLGVKTVGLFGPGDFTKWSYDVPHFKAIRRAPSCSPCYLDECFEHICMKLIDVDEVFKVAIEMAGSSRAAETGLFIHTVAQEPSQNGN